MVSERTQFLQIEVFMKNIKNDIGVGFVFHIEEFEKNEEF